MTQNQISILYALKEKAREYLGKKLYRQAALYLKDLMEKFEQIILNLENEQLIQRLIREIKIPSHKNLSLCHLKTNNYFECIQQAKKSLQIQPNNTKIMYRAGKACYSIGQLNQAQQYLKRAYILDPHEKDIMKALEEIERKKSIKHNSEENIKNSGIWSWIVFIVMLPFMFLKLITSDKSKKIRKQ